MPGLAVHRSRSPPRISDTVTGLDSIGSPSKTTSHVSYVPNYTTYLPPSPPASRSPSPLLNSAAIPSGSKASAIVNSRDSSAEVAARSPSIPRHRLSAAATSSGSVSVTPPVSTMATATSTFTQRKGSNVPTSAALNHSSSLPTSASANGHSYAPNGSTAPHLQQSLSLSTGPRSTSPASILTSPVLDERQERFGITSPKVASSSTLSQQYGEGTNVRARANSGTVAVASASTSNTQQSHYSHNYLNPQHQPSQQAYLPHQQQVHRNVHHAAFEQNSQPNVYNSVPHAHAHFAKSNGYIQASSAGAPSHSHPAGPSTTSSHSRRKSIAQAVTPSISTVRFASYCGLWYTSSALSSNTGKSIMNRFRYPVTLTFIQFGFVAGWCIVFLIGRAKIAQFQAGRAASLQNGGPPGSSKLRHSVSVPRNLQGWGIQTPSKHQLSNTLVMSVFQVGGHIFSSMAIARVPVSTVHTIKALSPLFTVLSYAVLFGARYTSKTYISLFPLTSGVMLACSFDFRANALGFLCALGSTLVFVSQNIFSKKLLPKDGATHHDHGVAGNASGAGERKLDKLHLLLYSSGVAFLCMIPLWAYYDASALLFGSPSAAPRTASIGTLVMLYTINGSVHFLQNLLAFAILALTSPVTYSIASLIKRIAVICMAIVWFGQHIYTVQAIGISLTFFGLWLYNQAKGDVERGEGARIRHERRASVLLPTVKEEGLTTPSKKGWGLVR